MKEIGIEMHYPHFVQPLFIPIGSTLQGHVVFTGSSEQMAAVFSSYSI